MQILAARRLIGTRPAAGRLVVLVMHGIVVQEATGQLLEEGEAIVFRPLGDSRFRVVGGRVLPREWGTLRRPSSAGAVALRARAGDRGRRGLWTPRPGKWGRCASPRPGGGAASRGA